MATTLDILRTVRFAPYRKGMGPTFTLQTWDTGRTDSYGKTVIKYRLTMSENNIRSCLFMGSDFCCAPSYAIDGDQCIASLMGFLTLRPGDTDKEYFADYTPEQLEYCSHHAEALSCEVMYRFGEG